MEWNLFIAGVIGALAPEIVRLYKLRENAQDFQSYYYLVSALFALLGGYVATIAPGVTQPWWAFCVGAGLVSVVSTAAKHADLLTGGGAAETRPVGATRSTESVPEVDEPGGLRSFFRAL